MSTSDEMIERVARGLRSECGWRDEEWETASDLNRQIWRSKATRILGDLLPDDKGVPPTAELYAFHRSGSPYLWSPGAIDNARRIGTFKDDEELTPLYRFRPAVPSTEEAQ